MKILILCSMLLLSGCASYTSDEIVHHTVHLGGLGLILVTGN